ncbi:hypothetical protein Hanom_Chr07g00609911 [Helianthus anomalus]
MTSLARLGQTHLHPYSFVQSPITLKYGCTKRSKFKLSEISYIFEIRIPILKILGY